jgi:peptide/nickel transport system substrate-binding protein
MRWLPAVRLLAVASVLAVGPAAAQTVRVAVPVPATSFGHPFVGDDGTSVRGALFDGLTSLTRDGKLEPALATAWRMTAPTTWVFDLRQGVVFHNGVPFTAEAVVAAIAYLQGAEGRTTVAAREVTDVVGARALGPHQVEIVTRAPDPIFPNRLANVAIPEPGAWARLGPTAFAMEPAGTGPYRPQKWSRGSGSLQLAAVPESWRAGEGARSVEMVILTDATARLQALLSRRVDIAVNLEPDQVEPVTAAGFTAHVMPAAHVLAIVFRTVGNERSPLADARVRRALNLAVDRTALVDVLLGGRVRLASQITTAGVFGHDPALAPYPHDPASAKRLLAEAGYPSGFGLTVGVFSGQVPGDTLMFQRVQQDLAAIGVTLTLRALPMADFMQRIFTGTWSGFDAFSTTLSSARYGDARQPIDFLSCTAPGAVFCAKELMPLIAASHSEPDVDRRRAMLQDIARRFQDLAPALLLTEYASITATASHVANYTARANGVLFERLRVAK